MAALRNAAARLALVLLASGAASVAGGADETCAAGPGGCTAGGPSVAAADKGRCDLSSVLSRAEDFPVEDVKSLEGMHAICIWDSDEGVRGYAHVGVVAGEPSRRAFTLKAKVRDDWKALRRGLVKKLGVKKASNGWGNLEFKQAFNLFTLDGDRIFTSRAALRAGALLLIEGGQWVWPPVRVGHIRPLGAGLELETLSLQPLVYSVSSFLQKEECRELVERAEEKLLSPSAVYRRKADNYRTSSDTRLESWEFDFIREIDLRVENLTKVPTVQHEDLQVARFEEGQYYAFHADAYDPEVHPDWAFIEHGHKNRILTMLWYLVDVDDGGHTHFPRAFGKPEPSDIHDCSQGLRVQPKQGNALLFYNLLPNGNFDDRARHAGCPPTNSEGKWSANKWIWNKPVPQRTKEEALKARQQ